ncbi:MAG TPA: hypothetical protein PLF76_04990, partial [Methanomassiliicoccaceae archaeon]|nr:hypothetical protein [Methanomassiliicoccaceae archaeon]
EKTDPATGISVPYIVMELVEGHTLRDLLRQGRPIEPQRAFEYEGGVFLFRTIVLEEGKDVAVYDMWDHTFTADMMKELLSSHGFIDIEMFSGLSSGPFSDDASWIGVKCRKA